MTSPSRQSRNPPATPSMDIRCRTDPQGEVLARLIPEGTPVRLRWAGGRIVSLRRHSRSGSLPFLVEPLLDLQVNGYAGVDFQDPALTRRDLERATRALIRDGCTLFFPTLITNRWETMLRQLARMVAFRKESPLLSLCIRGWHLEGPFLSPKEGYRGAHPARWMRDPSLPDLDEVLALTGNDPLLITLAPERRGALEFIRAGTRRGIRFSLGHCAASATELERAVDAGAGGITHLGNGIPALLDRHDNWFWTVADCRRPLHVGLIPDGIHLPPPLFRVLHRLLPARHGIYYASDAMAAAAAPPGRYRLGMLDLEAGTDRVVRMPGSPLLAGSALSPLEGVLRAAAMRGGDAHWLPAWKHFSRHPARFMGLPSYLHPGSPVRFCLVGEDAAKAPRELVLHLPATEASRPAICA